VDDRKITEDRIPKQPPWPKFFSRAQTTTEDVTNRSRFNAVRASQGAKGHSVLLSSILTLRASIGERTLGRSLSVIVNSFNVVILVFHSLLLLQEKRSDFFKFFGEIQNVQILKIS
jgi:hypothetical protein